MQEPNDPTKTLADAESAMPVPETLQRGFRLGRFTVLSAVGSGGMGRVFACYDPELDRRVAVKVLHRGHPSRRVLQEAKALARVSHPNVLTVYDVGNAGDLVFLAMELVEGQTLASWLHQEPRSWEEILEIFRQAGQGLEAVHQAGLAHRDFKPSNVMITADGTAKILDFGLALPTPLVSPSEQEEAREDTVGEDTARAKKESRSGTPAFMAPEQAAGQAADARSDQFSFSASLYGALYGHRPFEGATPEEMWHNARQGQFREPPASATAPKWIHAVLKRGLAADPEHRYPSMAELLKDLRRDRRRLLWRSVAGVSMAALAAFLIFSRLTQASPCLGGEARLAEAWSPTVKQSVEAAFLQSPAPFAGAAFAAISSKLDAYAAAWTTMYTETCEATRVRGDQSEDLLDRRMACLDVRKRELGALAEIFAEGDPATIGRAVEAVDDLPSLAPCADRRILLALEAPAAKDAEAVQNLREDLAVVRSLEATGRYAPGLAAAEELVQRAGELGYLPALAEAHWARGRLHGRVGRPQPMRDDLLAAAEIALATDHSEILAESQLRLMTASWLLGDTEEGKTWNQLARGAVSHLGNREDLDATRRFNQGLLAMREGAYDEAIELFQGYVEDPHRTLLQRAQALGNMAQSHGQAGRFDQAGPLFQESLSQNREALGPLHPNIGRDTYNLAIFFLRSGDIDQAEEHFLQALEILRGSLGPKSPMVVHPLKGLGEVALARGRGTQALEWLEQARQLQPRSEVDPKDLLELDLFYGQALWLSGDKQRGGALVRQVRQGLADAGPGAGRLLAEADAWLERHP